MMAHREAQLIERLIARDLPYYDAAVPQALIDGMSAFAMHAGLLDAPAVVRADIVADQFAHCWSADGNIGAEP